MSDRHLARSIDQTITGGAPSASAVAEEAQASQRDVHTYSVLEELSAGALDVGDAGSRSVEDVVGGAVEAGSVAGEVEVASHRQGQALILTSVQIESVLASHDIGLDLTIAINSPEPSVVADLAEAVGLIDEALVDSSKTDSSRKDLELVTAIGVESGGNDSAVILDHSGDHDRAGGGDVGAVDVGGGGAVDGHEDGGEALDDLVDGARDAGVVDQDVGEPALEAGRAVEGAARAIANFLRASQTGAIFQYEPTLASLAGDVAEADRAPEVDELAGTTVILASSRHQEVVGGAGGTGSGALTGVAAGRTGHATA